MRDWWKDIVFFLLAFILVAGWMSVWVLPFESVREAVIVIILILILLTIAFILWKRGKVSLGI